MSDNSGWIIHRQPTANNEDSDHNRYVWAMGPDGKLTLTSFMDVEVGRPWHPKPNTMPAPYKPPVMERIEGWAVVGRCINAIWRNRASAETSRRADERLAHLREVRDGDPSPEDVENAVRLITVTNTDFPESIGRNLRTAIELLGGKP